MEKDISTGSMTQTEEESIHIDDSSTLRFSHSACCIVHRQEKAIITVNVAS